MGLLGLTPAAFGHVRIVVSLTVVGAVAQVAVLLIVDVGLMGQKIRKTVLVHGEVGVGQHATEAL